MARGEENLGVAIVQGPDFLSAIRAAKLLPGYRGGQVFALEVPMDDPEVCEEVRRLGVNRIVPVEELTSLEYSKIGDIADEEAIDKMIDGKIRERGERECDG